MSNFEPGDKVWYVPRHADGPEHPDAEAGEVVKYAPSTLTGNYLVRYFDGSGVAKRTYRRDLEPRDE